MSHLLIMSKKRKIVNISLFVIFALFAIVQLNDPDPIHWVVIYGLIALVSLTANFKAIPKIVIYVLSLGVVGYAGMHFMYFIDYLQIEQKQELFGKMVYEKPYLEGTREFLGLLMAAAALMYQVRWTGKSK